MAKIDTSRIEGFDGMSAEDKLNALLNTDIPEPDYTGYVKKDVLDRTASELAAMKKKEREKLSEDERRNAEAAEQIRELTERLEAAENREKTASYTAKYISLGYDNKLAADTAAALIKGDMDKVFANHQTFLTAHDKAYKAELMGGMTPPPAGREGSSPMTLEAFRKLGDAEKFKFASEHPDEYKAMYEGGTT